MAGLLGSNITPPKMTDGSGLLGDRGTGWATIDQPVLNAPPTTMPVNQPVTGGMEPNPLAGTQKTMTLAPPAPSATTPLQRKLTAMYGTDPDLTNPANWEGNRYIGQSGTYTGANGQQATAFTGYQMGGGLRDYMSKYDPGAVTDAQIRQGLVEGRQGSRGLNDAEITQFMAGPNYNQRYQSLAESQGEVNAHNASNAAGAAASQAVNAARNADFQGTLNSMYGQTDPRRIASNYTEQKVNGTYIGPATNLPILGQSSSTSAPTNFSPVPPAKTPTPFPTGTTPTPISAPNPTPTPLPGAPSPSPGAPAPTPSPGVTPTPTPGAPSPSPVTGPTAPTGPGLTPGGVTSQGKTAAHDLSYGYNASTGSNVNSQATGYDPTNWDVNSQQTVEGRMRGILEDPNSPLMQQAKTRAAQEANGRGLLNTTMAMTAGEDAMIRAALPIAQQDASTYANSAQTNAGASNNSKAFGASASNASSNLNAQLGTQSNLTNSGETNKAYASTANAANAAEQLKIQTATQYYIKQLDVQTQKEMQAVTEQNKNLIQTNGTAAELNKSFAANMLQIQNSTMTAEAKKTAINTQIWALNNGLKTIGSIIGFNLGKYWQDSEGNPIQLTTNEVGGTEVEAPLPGTVEPPQNTAG